MTLPTYDPFICILPPKRALKLDKTSVQSSFKWSVKWILYLLKLSFLSPLVRHVSRCLLIKCWETLTEHTGHSTAKKTHKIMLIVFVLWLYNIFPCNLVHASNQLQLCNSFIIQIKHMKTWTEMTHLYVLLSICYIHWRWILIVTQLN